MSPIRPARTCAISRSTERDAARERSQGPQGAPSGDSARGLQVEGTVISPGGTYLASPGHQPGMPAAALSSCVGGMGVHWTCATPRPNDDERIDVIPPDELDAALDEAERLMQVTTLPENPYGSAIKSLLREHFGDTLPEGPPAGRPSDVGAAAAGRVDPLGRRRHHPRRHAGRPCARRRSPAG